jgi:class 3 adenylate cyclase
MLGMIGDAVAAVTLIEAFARVPLKLRHGKPKPDRSMRLSPEECRANAEKCERMAESPRVDRAEALRDDAKGCAAMAPACRRCRGRPRPCIGPAVNLAARIENLAGKLQRTILASDEFARQCPSEFVPVGEFDLAGFATARAVFGLEDEVERSGQHRAVS